MDTFSLFIEKGFNSLKKNGSLNYIVPLSITCSESMVALHTILFKNCNKIQISNYAKRPKQIFSSACTANSIFFCVKSEKSCENIFATKLNRLNKNAKLSELIDNLEFVNTKRHYLFGRIPKISSKIEVKILDELFSKENKPISAFFNENGKSIYYRKAGGRYYNVIANFSTTEGQSEGIMNFEKSMANAIGAILSSNLFWWFQQVYTDCFNLKMSDINYFTIPKIEKEKISKIENLYNDYLIDIQKNKTNQYNLRKSKHIIDQIDDLICPLYGLTPEETDFIKNYEIEFRLSDGEEVNTIERN